MKTSDSNKNPTPVMITILPLLAMLASILPSVYYNNADLDTVKLGFITFLLTVIVLFYIRVNSDLLNQKLAKTVILLSYLGSICLLLFVPDPSTFCLWMVGGLVTSMLIDSKLGLLLHFNLSFLMGIFITKRPEDVIQVLIIGVLMNMLAGSLKKPATVIYAAIIILSSNITLAFAINNFSFEGDWNNDYLKSLFSVFAVLLVAYLIGFAYQVSEKKATSKYSESVDALLEAYSEDQSPVSIAHINYSDSTIEITSINAENELFPEAKEDNDSIDAMISHGTRTSYDVLCDLENDLIKKMKQHSAVLYEHALQIGDLSYRAAMEIGANDMLALAGGLYHEVGKINGKNYIEEGLVIAEDYAFPNELKAIIKEHNIKYEKPGSVEAAIVMLSDSVVSTIDYIVKNDEHKFTTNKVIDNIFQLRMDKGTFDSADISLKNYKKLKEFYQKEFNK